MFVMALDIQIVNDEKVLLECILNFDCECLIGDSIIISVLYFSRVYWYCQCLFEADWEYSALMRYPDIPNDFF